MLSKDRRRARRMIVNEVGFDFVIPFITNESRFLGGRFHVLNIEKRSKLTKEIKRVLTFTNVQKRILND
jgi:hypothetical protein